MIKEKRKLSFIDKIILSPIWALTLLPLPVLFLFSDFIFYILYYVLKYRRKTVMTNLAKSFPNKTAKELKIIARKFYAHLSDYFIESIYLTNMSLKEANKRFKYKNPELLHDLYAKNQDVILMTSHYGNWEWAANLWHHIPYNFYGVYKQLTNDLFDKYFIHMREKYGSIAVHHKKTLKTIIKCKRNDDRFALYLIGDQRPIREDLDYWTRFLNQDTPFITGVEKLSRKFNLAVIFMNITKLRRGQYEVKFELLTEKPSTEKDYGIINKYAKAVEKQINKQPEYWLWSHKRWKFDPIKYKK